MKRRWHAYGLTLCFLTAGLIWVFVDITATRKQNHRAYYIRDTYKAEEQQTETPTTAPLNENFNYMLNNNSEQTDQASVQLVPSTSTPHGQVNTLEGTTTQYTSSKHIVAIVSYMRSGSTFTGDILQHFPGTVYVFEPLHMLYIRVRQHKPLYYLNGTRRFLKEENLTDSFVYEEVNKWFDCRYRELDVHSLADNFHAHFSRSMKKLIDCWRPKRHTLRSMRECLPSAIELCQNAKHRLFKFIRLPMRIMEGALKQFPNLQIVHLIRDPRGSLTSQVKVHRADWDNVENNSLVRCSAINNDLNSTFTFFNQYPERLRILIYERLATNPLEMAERLFTYLGLPSYDYVMRYISKLTSEGRNDGHSYGIIRGNSSKTAFSWRQQVDFQDVQVVDNICQHVYDILGFKPMKSPDDVTNDMVPTFVTQNVIGLL